MILKYCTDNVRVYTKDVPEWQGSWTPPGFEILKRFSLWETGSRYWLNNDYDRDPYDWNVDETFPTRIGKLLMQCEPCGECQLNQLL